MSMNKYILKWFFAVVLLSSLVMNNGFAKDDGCSITSPSPTINFGYQTSFTIVNKPLYTHVNDAGLTCKNPFLTLGYTQKMSITPVASSSATEAFLSQSGNNNLAERIPYLIYYEKSMSTPVVLGKKVTFEDKDFINILGSAGVNGVSTPVYVKIKPQNYNLPAGVYTDTITLTWNWDICTGLGIGLICIGKDKGDGVSVITVNLIVTEDCKISASDINFGSAPVTAAFSDVDGTINIICTKGTFYSVGLSKGDNFSGSRRMKSGSNFIDYEIYKGNQAHEVWGNQGSERRDSASADENPGAGWGGTKAQRFNYRAKILPNQPNKPAGTYIDHIMIDVEF